MSRRQELVGTIRSITYPGATLRPRVTMQLETDKGFLVLYFMSRTNIECLDIGSKVRVSGAVTRHRGVPTLFNPTFTVLEDDDV
ncbi:hypothetical protein CQ11_00975 [Trueperella pyogenes]|nr:hypothetical protein CQ11_00975 [Trueperella pyogenes]OQD39822.1 hypothetical protein B1R42_01980 [Trueperella pyogenes]OQD40133.1 hypothetical protein B1R42_01390 [Trueperella pyogenes]